MGPFEAVRDKLRSGEISYTFLDGAQLVKHAFGLVTDARRHSKKPVLVYIFAEPQNLNGRIINLNKHENHRQEIADFNRVVQGAEVEFHSISYDEWIASWKSCDPAIVEHGRNLTNTFLNSDG